MRLFYFIGMYIHGMWIEINNKNLHISTYCIGFINVYMPTLVTNIFFINIQYIYSNIIYPGTHDN